MLLISWLLLPVQATYSTFPPVTAFLLVLHIFDLFSFVYSQIRLPKIPPPCLSPPFSSVQFTRSVISDSLLPHESQHARPPCPSPTPGAHSDSRPLSRWCHSAISSSVVPFSSCFQSLPVSESFPMSQLFAWGGQSTGVSASASFLPKKSQGIRMDRLDLLAVQGTLKSLLQHHRSKASTLRCSAFFTVQLSHPHHYSSSITALCKIAA